MMEMKMIYWDSFVRHDSPNTRVKTVRIALEGKWNKWTNSTQLNWIMSGQFRTCLEFCLTETSISKIRAYLHFSCINWMKNFIYLLLRKEFQIEMHINMNMNISGWVFWNYFVVFLFQRTNNKFFLSVYDSVFTSFASYDVMNRKIFTMKLSKWKNRQTIWTIEFSTLWTVLHFHVFKTSVCSKSNNLILCCLFFPRNYTLHYIQRQTLHFNIISIRVLRRSNFLRGK